MKDHDKRTADHPLLRRTRRGEELIAARPVEGAATERHLHRPPLDVEGAAAYLGTTVRHVRRLVGERRIPYAKLGGKLRFLPPDLDRWLEAQRVEAQP